MTNGGSYWLAWTASAVPCELQGSSGNTTLPEQGLPSHFWRRTILHKYYCLNRSIIDNSDMC